MKKLLLKNLKETPLYRIETLLVVLSIALASLGAYIQHAHEREMQDDMLAQYATVQVVAVKENLKRNSILKKSHLRLVSVLRQRETSNMLKASMIDQIVGRSLDIDVLAGDLILFSMVSDLNSKHTMAEKIPIGKRLFTLLVENTQGPSGFLRPGDHVDIVAKINFPDKGMTTFTLLEDVGIVAIDQLVDPSLNIQGKHVSFFVNPDEMERLRFAQEAGTFYVSLRNPFDKVKLGERKGVNFDSFILSDRVYESVDPKVKVHIEKKK